MTELRSHFKVNLDPSEWVLTKDGFIWSAGKMLLKMEEQKQKKTPGIQWRHQKFGGGEHQGAKCISERAKIPKFAKLGWFWLFFSSDWGCKWGGGQSLQWGGGQIPHGHAPLRPPLSGYHLSAYQKSKSHGPPLYSTVPHSRHNIWMVP